MLPETEYADPVRSREFFDRLQRDTASLPGVQSVGAGTDLPFESNLQRIFTPEPPARLTGTESIIAIRSCKAAISKRSAFHCVRGGS